MPKFGHEKAVRFEMSPEAAEGLQRVLFRQQISEGPEHAHGRVERSAESKRTHVGADEPGSPAYRGGLLPREGEHLGGPVGSSAAISAAGEGEIVVAGAR